MANNEGYHFDRVDQFSAELTEYVKKNVNPNIDSHRAKWEYIQGEKKPIFYVVKKNNTTSLLGTQALIHIEGNYKGQRTSTGKSECTFIDNELRGTAAFKELYTTFLETAFNENIDIVWGLTSAVKIWKEKLNFDFADFVIHDFILTNSPNFKAANKKSFVHGFFEKFRSKRKIKNLATRHIAIKAVSELTEEDVQWRKNVLTKLNTPFFIGSDKAYYSWRITQNPYITYSIWKFEKEKEMIGYIITSKIKNRLIIHEWLTCDLKSISEQLHIIRQQLISFHEEIYYFGNLQHPINKAIHEQWISQGGSVKISNWAGLVVKSNHPDIDSHDIQNGFINLLWTEGVN